MQGDWKAKGSKIYEKGRLRGESHSSIDIGNLWRKNQTSEQQSDSYRLHAIIEKNRPSSVWRNFLCFFFFDWEFCSRCWSKLLQTFQMEMIRVRKWNILLGLVWMTAKIIFYMILKSLGPRTFLKRCLYSEPKRLERKQAFVAQR